MFKDNLKINKENYSNFYVFAKFLTFRQNKKYNIKETVIDLNKCNNILHKKMLKVKIMKFYQYAREQLIYICIYILTVVYCSLILLIMTLKQ